MAVYKMQFRDYVFQNNPRVIRVSSENKVAVHFCPGKGDVLQNMGKRARIIQCEGCFWGGTLVAASAQLSRFEQAVKSGEYGALYIPGQQPMNAHLESLEWEASGDGRVIEYKMTFRERV